MGSSVFPRGSVTHEVDITDTVDVSDEVDAATAHDEPLSEAAIAKAITLGIAQATEKSWWERWGSSFTLGLLTVFVALTTGWLAFIRSEPPDCTAYANALLAIHRQAPTNEAAVRAVEAIGWGNFDEHCGNPAELIRPLGDPPPATVP